MRIRTRLLLIIVPLVILMFGALLYLSLNVSKKIILQHIGYEAHYLARSYALEIDLMTRPAMEIAEGIANAIETFSTMSNASIKKLIYLNLKRNPEIYGSAVALVPQATQLGYYSPYYYRSNTGMNFKSLSTPSYHYSKWDWFKLPIQTGKGFWTEPYFDESGGNILMTTYSTPVYRKKTIIGVATVDISLETLVKKLKSLRLDESGYAFIISKTGHLIAYPDEQRLWHGTLWLYAEKSVNPHIKKFAALMKNPQSSNDYIMDPFTGKESLLITMPVESTGWKFAIIASKDSVLSSVITFQKIVGGISIVIAAMLTITILFISFSVTSPLSRLVTQTQRYAEGAFKERLETTEGFEEIRKLSLSFNIMGDAIEEKIQELKETQKEIVFHLGRAAEFRDKDTGSHIRRVSYYCELLGRKYGLSEEECEILLYASPMHDIGKVGIPDHILFKEGALDDEEKKVMETHTTIGWKIISGGKSKLIQAAQIIAYNHHERWDGSGYPRGLKAEDIPLLGRITCICDVFDALTSQRPYKQAWTTEEAFMYIRSMSGKHFDPSMVALLSCIMQDFVKIREQFP